MQLTDLKGGALCDAQTPHARGLAGALSACCRFIATCGTGDETKIWLVTQPSSEEGRSATLRPIMSLPGHGRAAVGVSLSVDGRRAATLSAHGDVFFWDLNVRYDLKAPAEVRDLLAVRLQRHRNPSHQ